MKALFLVAVVFYGFIPTQAGNGTISGRLLTQEKVPASGVRVAAIPVVEQGQPAAISEDLISLTTTDEMGRFRLENLPPGRYLVLAGSVYLPTFYPGKLQRSDATMVTVRPNSPATGVDFGIVIPEGINVRGRFIPPAGPATYFANPVANLVRDGSVVLRAPLHPDGSFEFRETPPGSYLLRTTGYPEVAVTVPEKGLLSVEVKLPTMVQLMATWSVDDGSTPPEIALSFEGVQRTVTLGPSRALGFVLPTGEYKVVASLLPPGYALKSLTLDGVSVSPDRIKLTESEDDLQLRAVLTRRADGR